MILDESPSLPGLVVECPNFLVCGGRGSKAEMIQWGGRCLQCNMTLGENLDVLAAADADETCAICMDQMARVKLPQCSHRFCGDCIFELYYGQKASKGRYQLQGTLDSHLSTASSRDKGCPVCRSQTLQPAWQHTGQRTCRCKRCQHECARCGAACGFQYDCACRVAWYCSVACREAFCVEHRSQCVFDTFANEEREALLGREVYMNDTHSVLLGTPEWAITAYEPPKPKVHNGLFKLEGRHKLNRGFSMRMVPIDVVLAALEDAKEAAATGEGSPREHKNLAFEKNKHPDSRPPLTHGDDDGDDSHILDDGFLLEAYSDEKFRRGFFGLVEAKRDGDDDDDVTQGTSETSDDDDDDDDDDDGPTPARCATTTAHHRGRRGADTEAMSNSSDSEISDRPARHDRQRNQGATRP